jgi:hypothetical protein
MKNVKERSVDVSGPVQTRKIGYRITVYGDLEVIAIEGRRVKARVVKASAPVMFPAKE